MLWWEHAASLWVRIHITAPPHHCASTSLRIHITAHPHHCASTSLRLHITAHPHHCASTSLRIHITAHPHHCASIHTVISNSYVYLRVGSMRNVSDRDEGLSTPDARRAVSSRLGGSWGVVQRLTHKFHPKTWVASSGWLPLYAHLSGL